MDNTITSVKTARIESLDFMRVFACFMVVLAHSCDFFVGMFDTSPISFYSAAFWGTLQRASVPLFVMISGMLLLPMRDTVTVFYKKRMSRVLIPFIVWSILSPLAYYAYGMITLDKAVNFILLFPISFNLTTVPFWYIYMLIGLYLIVPVISPWLQTVSKKGLETYFKFWIITLFIPYIKFFAPALGYEGNYGSMAIFGMCDWNAIGLFHYTSGFIGYLLLGHYAVKYPLDWSMRKSLAIGLPTFIVGAVITYFGFISVAKNFPALEVIWYFTNINVFMMTFGLFVILRKVNIKNLILRKFIAKLSTLTFGIYLIHFLFVQMSYDWIKNYEFAPYLQIPVIALVAFTVTGCFTYLLSKLPFGKHLVG